VYTRADHRDRVHIRESDSLDVQPPGGIYMSSQHQNILVRLEGLLYLKQMAVQQNTVFSLIQFIALALPAVAIYIQILQRSHIEVVGDYERDKTDEYVDYHLARGSLLLFLLSAVLLIITVLINLPPAFLKKDWASSLVLIPIYCSVISIGSGLLLFGLSVFVRKETIDKGKGLGGQLGKRQITYK